MIPSMTATGRNASESRATASSGLRLHADGIRHHARWTPPGEHARRAVAAVCSPLGARSSNDVTAITQPGVAERLSRDARHIECRVPERGARPSGPRAPTTIWEPRSIRSPRSTSAANATAVAGTVDGSAVDGRPMRQRLCVRLSEQSFLVVADDAACRRKPIRGSFSRRCSAMAADGAAASGRAAEASQPAGFGDRGDRSGCKTNARGLAIATRSTSTWRAFAKSNGESSEPRRRAKDNPLPDLDRPVGVPADYADHRPLDV